MVTCHSFRDLFFTGTCGAFIAHVSIVLFVSMFSVTSSFASILIGWITVSFVLSAWLGLWSSIIAQRICKREKRSLLFFGGTVFAAPYLSVLFSIVFIVLVSQVPPLTSVWISMRSAFPGDELILMAVVILESLTVLLLIFMACLKGDQSGGKVTQG